MIIECLGLGELKNDTLKIFFSKLLKNLRKMCTGIGILGQIRTVFGVLMFFVNFAIPILTETDF